MHYLDEGPKDGPPVVMLHGNPTWSFHFRRLVRALAPDHRCLVPDHVGMGLSARPADGTYPFTLERRVEDLSRLLDRLEPERPLTLVVHDWGGAIGAVCAGRRPARVARLVILNTAAFPLPPGARVPWALRACRTALGPFLVQGLNLFCRGAARACVTRPLAPDVRRAYLAPYDSWANRRAVFGFVEDIPLAPDHRSYPLLEEAEETLPLLGSRPTLILWGLRDFVFGAPYLERWQALLPDAEVHAFADAGHYLLEDAGDAVVPLIRDFLDRTTDQVTDRR